ncbi:hypothetical protein V6N13_120889 [Hibiscus sabdariffa]
MAQLVNWVPLKGDCTLWSWVRIMGIASSRCTVHCHCCFIDLELLPQILKSPRLLRILVGRFVENKALLV